MDLILQQLADLFLRSIPTVVLFLLLVISYRLLVHRPLLKVLAERRERTTGAVARAEAAIRAADARSQEYEAKLRTARAEIFHARELRMQALQRERDRVLEEARHASHETVRGARERLDAEAADARATLDSRADALAAEILRVIVPSATSVGARSAY
ncbi:MAG TPA: ATP synthase F0 subunit B [Acidobacteriaceae bacterium]